MAEYLASIFGTEKDKVNCSFYFKIGACRHGDRCSRIHNKPTFSQTLVIQNLYINPQNSAKTADGSHLAQTVSDEEMQEHYDNFFEEVFAECEDRYGEIEEMNVCDNLGDHLVGNVYIKFKYETDAEAAVKALNNRWFGGRPVYAELSPVTDFREACCRCSNDSTRRFYIFPKFRQYEMGECTRAGFCNFMHLKVKRWNQIEHFNLLASVTLFWGMLPLPCQQMSCFFTKMICSANIPRSAERAIQ